MEGYRLFRRISKDSRGGGVSVYVREKFPVQPLQLGMMWLRASVWGLRCLLSIAQLT